MTTLSKQYTFAVDETGDPDQVNTNFDDLYGFVNTEAMQRDCSIPFTGYPTVPGVSPSNATDLAPKGYVDALVPRLKGGLYTGATSAGSVTITHGLGAIVTSAVAIPNTATTSAGGDLVNISCTGGNINTVTFKVTNSATGAAITGNVRFNWMAFAPPS